MGKLRKDFEKIVSDTFNDKDREEILSLLDSFDDREELFNILIKDFQKSHELLQKEILDQYYRRTYVRTSFALIEGLINILSQTVLEYCKNSNIILSKDEIEKLTEKTKNKKGELRFKFMSLSEKVQFSLFIFANKIGEFDFSIDSTSIEWKNFDQAINIRNQLMHPRTPNELTINNEQISIVLKATTWFIKKVKDVELQVNEKITINIIKNLSKKANV